MRIDWEYDAMRKPEFDLETGWNALVKDPPSLKFRVWDVGFWTLGFQTVSLDYPGLLQGLLPANNVV